jgi:hypothetical protein
MSYFLSEVFMPLALRSRFLVGIYDPNYYDSWPYFHAFDEGIFLSKNKRFCKFNSAINFDLPEQARAFYSSWKRSSLYRLHVFEYKTHIDVPALTFPPKHPRSILLRIRQNEPSSLYSTAFTWFMGSTDFLCSKSTLSRHRLALLNYGIDIHKKRRKPLVPLPSLDDDTWYLSKPDLTVA